MRCAPGTTRRSARGWPTATSRSWATPTRSGREAVTAQLSVLDLAETHHRALQDALDGEEEAARRGELLAAAGVFFGEALSTFEIAHRGYHEVQEVARLEHEYVTQLRALGEWSVRINATMTTEEVLQLTVEAAQRVLGAGHATISSTSGDPFSRGAQRRLPGRRHAGGADRRADRRDAAQRRAAARDARGRRRRRPRVHRARRGDPRPARPAGLRRHRQVAGLHARAPHLPGAPALAAAAEHPDACRASRPPSASSPPATGSRSAATSTTSSGRASTASRR